MLCINPLKGVRSQCLGARGFPSVSVMILFFDFDGVIVDSFDHILHLLRETWREMRSGREPVEDDLRSCRDLTFSGIAKSLGLSAEDSDHFKSEICRRISESREALPLFDGVAALLRELSDLHQIVILTSSIRDSVFSCLKSESLKTSISEVVDANDPGSKSEKISRYLRGVSALERDAVMVGDTYSDIVQAKMAGLRSIAVTWGYQDEAFLSQAGPDFIARNVSELRRVISLVQI